MLREEIAGQTGSADLYEHAGVGEGHPHDGDHNAIALAEQHEIAGHYGVDARIDGAGDDDGGLSAAEPLTWLAPVIDQLVELQVRRTFYIKRIGMLDNSVKALARRALGWQWDMTEPERKKLNAQASKLVAMMLASHVPPEGLSSVASAIAADLAVVRDAREPLVSARTTIEKQMRKLARSLPVWPWAEQVRGLGELGVAVIVGETGDLSNYATKERVWKRLGLAVLDGKRQGNPGKNASAEDWTAHGYNPRRRAEMFAVIGDPLFRAQSQRVDRETGEITAEAGVYRTVYDAEKAKYLEQGKTKAHAHMHGQRVMTKRLLEDFWRAWREARFALMPKQEVPPADPPALPA